MIPLLDNFEYKSKPWYSNLMDEILSPIRELSNRRKIQCIETNGVYTFRIPNSRAQPTFLSTITKIISAAFTPSPLVLTALVFKGINQESQQQLRNRFENTENFWKLGLDKTGKTESKDRIEERAILDDSAFFRAVDFFSKQFSFSELRDAAHILGHKSLRGTYNVNLQKYEKTFIENYEGGLYFTSGQMLNHEFSKCAEPGMFSADIGEAKKKIEEYNQWGPRFLGIMLLRYLPITVRDLIKDLAIDLQDRVKSLKLGESFLIPLVIKPTNEFKFHVINARFMHVDDNNYGFTVYNVGCGRQHHIDFNGWVFPYHIQSIPLSHLYSLDDFLIPLINHATFEAEDENCNRFYDFLETYFKAIVGEENFRIRDKRNEAAKMPQLSGLCIWKSLTAALKDCMPIQSYKCFVLKMKRNRWWELYQKYHHKEDVNSTDKYDAELLIKSAELQLKSCVGKFAEKANLDSNDVLHAEFTQEQIKALNLKA